MSYQIAIDGPAGAGKSTIAKKVARLKEFIYVDTGAMYRAMAYYLFSKQVDPKNEEAVSRECRGAHNDVVMDGRDIGTCVLPDADVKVYLTASVEVRAKRRYDELTAKGVSCDIHQIEEDIAKRDEQDMNREIAPLKQAEDAVLVDSSNMTIDEVVQAILTICK